MSVLKVFFNFYYKKPQINSQWEQIKHKFINSNMFPDGLIKRDKIEDLRRKELHGVKKTRKRYR